MENPPVSQFFVDIPMPNDIVMWLLYPAGLYMGSNGLSMQYFHTQ